MRAKMGVAVWLAMLVAVSCARETRVPAANPAATPPGAPATGEPPAEPRDDTRYPQVTPVTPVQGRVVFLNPRLRFVIVDFAFHRPPRLEQRLGVFRAGRRVGEVRISGPADGTTIVADVMSGEAAVGDLVRED
jgi:hypothetical protein